MNRKPVHPPSIQQMGGLQKFLDSKKQQHNGNGYTSFVKCIDARLSKAAIGRLFGVDPRTITNWIRVYEEEQAAK